MLDFDGKVFLTIYICIADIKLALCLFLLIYIVYVLSIVNVNGWIGIFHATHKHARHVVESI